VPAYNSYIRGSKEKVALSFAGTLAAAAAAYYGQSQNAPTFADLSIDAPLGYSAVVNNINVVVSPAGSPEGYKVGDFASQSVVWR